MVVGSAQTIESETGTETRTRGRGGVPVAVAVLDGERQLVLALRSLFFSNIKMQPWLYGTGI
jgi:hypothetical protein